MMRRPAFYFVVHCRITLTDSGLWVCREIDPYRLSAIPVFSDLAWGLANISFAVLPVQHSLEYRLFLARLRATQKHEIIRSLVKGWLENQTLPKRWQLYDRMLDGIFYTSTGSSAPLFMEILADKPLAYLSWGGKDQALGPVRQVKKIATGLTIDKNALARIKGTLQLGSGAKPGTAVAPSTPNPKAVSSETQPRPFSPVQRKPTQLTWEALPMGWWKDYWEERGDGNGWRTPLNTERRERLRFLESLGPRAWYKGSHLAKRVYFLALFDRLAMADCPDWGNALYYCGMTGGSGSSVSPRKRHSKRELVGLSTMATGSNGSEGCSDTALPGGQKQQAKSRRVLP